MNEKTKVTISIVLKFATAVCAVWGLIKCMFAGGFMGGSTLMLYFTMQSNVWIAIVEVILAVMLLKRMKSGNFELDNRLYIVQNVFTVSITLTGCVFCFVLLPSFMSMGNEMKNVVLAYEQIFLHVLVPLLAVVDHLVFTRHSHFKKTQFLWAALPPIYYLIFAAVGYVMNWDFGGGNNYPYFFFNYGSPAGFFGFSDVMPYFMGSFYWILALTVFVLAVSAIYTAIINRMIKRKG